MSTKPRKRSAQDLLNTLLEPGNAGRYGQLTNSIPVVQGAEMTEEQRNNPALNLDMADNSIVLDFGHIGEIDVRVAPALGPRGQVQTLR